MITYYWGNRIVSNLLAIRGMVINMNDTFRMERLLLIIFMGARKEIEINTNR